MVGCGRPSGADTADDATSDADGSGTSGGSDTTTGTGDQDTGTESGTETGADGVCGDGLIDDGEQCDDGELNGEYGACAADCAGGGPHCGDGVLNGPEPCDDGNDDGLDGCSNACQKYSCGDQIAQPGELCFHPFTDHAVTDDPGALLVIDLDGDQHLDVVVGDVLGAEVVVAMGDGTGSLGDGEAHAGPELVHDLVAAEIDADGNPDVLAVGRSAGYVVLLGDGLGGLSVAATSGEAATSATAVDLDADGRADLVLGGEGSTHVRLGEGDGNFTPHDILAHDGWLSDWAITTDLDQDQAPDLVLALDETDELEPAGELRTLLGQGAGTLAPAQTFALADDADRILATNIDADGYADVVALRGGQPCEGGNKRCAGVNWRHPTLGEITTYLSDPQQPGVLAEVSSTVVGFDPSDIAASDLDQDANVDIAVAYFAFGWLELLRGDGMGGFTREKLDAVGFRHVDIELADLNEDGVDDIIMTRAALGEDPGAVRIRLSNP